MSTFRSFISAVVIPALWIFLVLQVIVLVLPIYFYIVLWWFNLWGKIL